MRQTAAKGASRRAGYGLETHAGPDLSHEPGGDPNPGVPNTCLILLVERACVVSGVTHSGRPRVP